MRTLENKFANVVNIEQKFWNLERRRWFDHQYHVTDRGQHVRRALTVAEGSGLSQIFIGYAASERAALVANATSDRHSGFCPLIFPTLPAPSL